MMQHLLLIEIEFDETENRSSSKNTEGDVGGLLNETLSNVHTIVFYISDKKLSLATSSSNNI